MRARWSSGQGVSDMNLMVHGPSPGLLPRIEFFTIRKTIYFTAFPSILLGNWGSFARMLEITVMDQCSTQRWKVTPCFKNRGATRFVKTIPLESWDRLQFKKKVRTFFAFQPLLYPPCPRHFPVSRVFVEIWQDF